MHALLVSAMHTDVYLFLKTRLCPSLSHVYDAYFLRLTTGDIICEPLDSESRSLAIGSYVVGCFKVRVTQL